jgi:hypothetical protein
MRSSLTFNIFLQIIRHLIHLITVGIGNEGDQMEITESENIDFAAYTKKKIRYVCFLIVLRQLF